MSNDNIHFIRSNNKALSEPITIDIVVEAMKEWRLTKLKFNEKIPENIWDQILTLIETIPASSVIKKLGIKPGQLQSKKIERQYPLKSNSNTINITAIPNLNSITPKIPAAIHSDTASTQPVEKNNVEFCEVKPSSYPLIGKPAKAFDTSTCVVELYRPDGMLMKIHICTDRFDELLSAFYSGGTKC